MARSACWLALVLACQTGIATSEIGECHCVLSFGQQARRCVHVRFSPYAHDNDAVGLFCRTLE